MGKTKDAAMEVLAALPDDCTWAELRYRLYVREKVEEGLAAAAAGDVVPHEQVMREMEEWLASLEAVEPDAIRTKGGS